MLPSNTVIFLKKLAAEAPLGSSANPIIVKKRALEAPTQEAQTMQETTGWRPGRYQFFSNPSKRFKELNLSDNTAWIRQKCKEAGVRFEDFIDSIHSKESTRGIHLLGDKDSKGNYTAFGHFQMHKPALKDANEYSKTKIGIPDLNDPDVALNAMMSYLTRYGKSFEKNHPGAKWNPLLHGYMQWNGGPDGWSKEIKSKSKEKDAWANVTKYRREAHDIYKNIVGLE